MQTLSGSWLCAILLCTQGVLGATEKAVEKPRPDGYWYAPRGLEAVLVSKEKVGPSLFRIVPCEDQIPCRYPGAATPRELCDQDGRPCECWMLGRYELFPSQSLTFMPYLDGLYQYGNIAIQPGAMFQGDALSTSAQYVKEKLSRIGITYFSQTVVGYTQFAGDASSSGKRSFFSSHSSTVGSWSLLREPCSGSGLFATASIKQGSGFGFDANSENPNRNLGAATDVSGYFQRENVVLGQLALGGSMMNGKLVVLGGMIDIGNYMDRNTYSGNSSSDLVNKAFVNAGALPVSISGLGFHVGFQPNEKLYFLFSSLSDNTPPNQNPFDRVSINNWGNIAEVGLVRDDVLGLGKGIYRFQPFFTTTGGDCGYGMGLNCQQQLGKGSSYGWFFRGAWADPESATIRGIKFSGATGLVLHAPFGIWKDKDKQGINNEYIGLGFFWTEAAKHVSKTNQHEYGVELTYTMQVTPTMMIQPDVQFIRDPVYGKRRGQSNVVFQVQTIWVF